MGRKSRTSAAASTEGAALRDAAATVFGISPQDLSRINEEQDDEELSRRGGVQGIAAALFTDTSSGLSVGTKDILSLQARSNAFGANRFKQVKQKSLLSLIIGNLKDPTLLLLMAAAMISTILGAAIKSEREQSAWSEGVAIWVAVIVVSGVGAGNDYQKDRQFRKLNDQKDIIEVKVLRGAEEQLITNTDLVVGDVLVLDTGDRVVADGLYISGHSLVIDEASLTGESDPKRKSHEKPWLRSGTQVTEGDGNVLVTAVGTDSEWGRTMALVSGESEATPLQNKLTDLAGAIARVGLTVAVLAFLVLTIRWMVENKGFPLSKFAEGPLAFFIFGVTILVVAVPEGLPLAVTISLAFSMKRMIKDNNFVRVLAACETMGSATAICSDKTGTLTENRMTVMEGWFAGTKYASLPAPTDLSGAVFQEMMLNCALNSKAFLVEHDKDTIEFVGNRTECALLMMMRKWATSYKDVRAANVERVVQVFGFSSAKKMASVLVRTEEGFRLYNKGAAEWVLEKCTASLNSEGAVVPLSNESRQDLIDVVTEMAERGLRTLCLAYTDLPAEGNPAHFLEVPFDENLVAMCILGIKDPVRAGVQEAVETCKRAGITVRMVTGDNIHTAKHIARECGILSQGGLAMEGPEFRALPDDDLKALLPRLQVLARSSPTDKFKLVRTLKEMGEVVGVTGDGTNDAPALKESDVGLAMGIAGTEVAKEAADIVIMDDNFRSIVKSVLWGRSVFDNIRKFLMFQLTVNFVALVVAFVAAVGDGQTPLNVLQLLWVNLIMDSLGALALATELPRDALLLRKPAGRTEPLISKKMWKHILVQGLYQMFWLFLILFGMPQYIPGYEVPSLGSTFPGYLSYAGVTVNVLPSGLNLAGIPTYNLQDGKGPRTDLCCTPGLDCLLSDPTPGWYLADGEVMCTYTEALGASSHDLLTAMSSAREPQELAICGDHPTTSCKQRFTILNDLYGQADKQHKSAVKDGQKAVNSIIFNVFIFCQLFNQINSRKTEDEYNVFDGILQSHAFLSIWVICIGLQAMFMEAVPGVFKIRPQNWSEWLLAIGIGAGSLLIALATKFISRCLVSARSS